MKNKFIIILMSLFFIVLLTSFVSPTLGTFKQGDCVPLKMTLDAEYINITTLTSPAPNPETLLTGVKMEKNGKQFNYTFCDTLKLGEYTYAFCDDIDGCYENNFFVTSSGVPSSGANIAFFIIIILLIYGIAGFGLYTRNVVFTILGGMALLVLGVYLFNNGIIIFRDDITKVISYTTIGIGAVLAIWASYEWYKDM